MGGGDRGRIGRKGNGKGFGYGSSPGLRGWKGKGKGCQRGSLLDLPRYVGTLFIGTPCIYAHSW